MTIRIDADTPLLQYIDHQIALLADSLCLRTELRIIIGRENYVRLLREMRESDRPTGVLGVPIILVDNPMLEVVPPAHVYLKRRRYRPDNMTLKWSLSGIDGRPAVPDKEDTTIIALPPPDGKLLK